MHERSAMAFAPTTAEAVQAIRDAVATAERIRAAECDKRGPRCRDREFEEQAKRDALAAALTSKAATDQAAKLDQDAAVVRARLARAPAIENPNPLGATLELLIGAAAAALTAWQQTIVAAVFELCLVGVMVIYELLGQTRDRVDQTVRVDGDEPAVSYTRDRSAQPRPLSNGVFHAAAVPMRPRRRPLAKSSNRSRRRARGVTAFVRDRLFPADGERVEMKVLMQSYRAWCAQKGHEALGLDAFLDEIEGVCCKAGIAIEAADDRHVYCLNVSLTTSAAGVPERPLICQAWGQRGQATRRPVQLDDHSAS